MAKLSSASIRLVLKKNRKMSSGEYPIYIVVCFNGRLEKTTGVSCLERHWDAKRETIKSGQPIVEVDKVVMYSARHSRASNYFNTPGSTIGGLASMLGRSASTISVYAHLIKKHEELAEIDKTCPI